jgi:phosphatidylinositol kinase/protein kinase (PI-3  family)
MSCLLPAAVSCYALLLSGRAPNKTLLARDSGKVMQWEMVSIYDDTGLLARSEAVPFRLTRNLVAFFGAFGVEVSLCLVVVVVMVVVVVVCLCAWGV